MECGLKKLESKITNPESKIAPSPMIDFAETLSRLRGRLARPEQIRPAAEAVPQAAVAIILREGDGTAEMLVIQRAENPSDHWSGHLALPGGRSESKDASLLATAAREVEEEVGIKLSLSSDFIGQLGTYSPSNPRLPSISVTPFVAISPEVPELQLSCEVADAFWISVSELKRSGRSTSRTLVFEQRLLEWPAYPSKKGPIWGITERIISDFLNYLD